MLSVPAMWFSFLANREHQAQKHTQTHTIVSLLGEVISYCRLQLISFQAYDMFYDYAKHAYSIRLKDKPDLNGVRAFL